MIAVGAPRDAGAVVAEVFAAQERRPVGEYDVVFVEAFLGERRR